MFSISLGQAPVPQDRLRRLRTAVRPQELALRYPDRGDVWECPTNYVKRGLGTLYQEVLLVKMTEALQVLAGRSSTAIDQALDSLAVNGCAATTIDAPHGDRRAPDRIADPACAPHAGLPCHAGGRLPAITDGRLGFVFITGEAVTLDLPQHWSPVMRHRRTRSYRALLTGLAKAFRSSHESARAVSCS